MKTLRLAAAIAVILPVTISTASAKRYTDRQPYELQYGPTYYEPSARIHRKYKKYHGKRPVYANRSRYRHVRVSRSRGTIVAHPAGCPRTRFCGCGVALRVFGKPVARGGLAQARNWLKFPSAAPAAGMVAAKQHHVVYIERMDANGNAVVYNPNSGGHKTRIQTISLRGYRVVNPHTFVATATP